MKTLQIEQLEMIQGGGTAGTIAGVMCGAAASGLFFGGVGIAFTGAAFGPACLTMGIISFIVE